MAPRQRGGGRNRRLATRGGPPGRSGNDGIGTRRGGNSDRGGSTSGHQAARGVTSDVGATENMPIESSPETTAPTSFASYLSQVPLGYRVTQNEEEFLKTAQKWHDRMQTYDFSSHPLLPDGFYEKGRAVWHRLKVGLTETPNPFLPAIRAKAARSSENLYDCLEPCYAKLAKGDWLGAVLELLKADNAHPENEEELRVEFRSSFASTLEQLPLDWRATQDEEEFLITAQKWHQRMQTYDFSSHPLLDNSAFYETGSAVWYRLRVGLTETPNPFAPAILVDAVGSSNKVFMDYGPYKRKLAERNWIGAVVELFKTIRPVVGTAAHEVERQRKLYDHWCGNYGGNSVKALQTTIRDYETKLKSDAVHHYSKSICIFQSSGMGKSRLADEMGKTNFQFSFVFRRPRDTGYPPADMEVISYFRDTSTHPSILAAALYTAVAIIGIRDLPGGIGALTNWVQAWNGARIPSHQLAQIEPLWPVVGISSCDLSTQTTQPQWVQSPLVLLEMSGQGFVRIYTLR
jgi:hypothetical protein